MDDYYERQTFYKKFHLHNNGLQLLTKQRNTYMKENFHPNIKYIKVFFKGAKRLPPLQSEDMALTLKEGASKQLDCKVYPLSKREFDVLQQSLIKIWPKDTSNMEPPHLSHLYFSC